MKKNNYNIVLELLSDIKDIVVKYKKIIIIIVGILFTLSLFNFIIPQINEYKAYKNDIKSLQKENKELIKQQQKLDDYINEYQKNIDILDKQIGNIKEKTIIIKEYYREKNEEINNYSSSQIDSFFKARYKY